jgi:5-deoxy-glucuronate isomerase
MTGADEPVMIRRRIASESPANSLDADHLRIEPDVAGELSIDPIRAGWRYLSFETRVLVPGQTIHVGDAGREHAVMVVSGPGATVASVGSTFALRGRRSPFDDGPAAVYLPPDMGASVASPANDDRSTILAIASAPGSRGDGVATEAIAIEPGDCRIEVRGAGTATRQITHVIPPEFAADRLLVVEVITPAGNWSSWPPHKHDVDAGATEAVLEEVYYYGFRRPEGWGVQRVYRREGSPLARSSGPRDAAWAVRHGEAVIVTDGYHPFAASFGDDAWYLNALAGDRRTMACSFDPAHEPDIARWTTMAADPRVPVAWARDLASGTGPARG